MGNIDDFCHCDQKENANTSNNLTNSQIHSENNNKSQFASSSIHNKLQRIELFPLKNNISCIYTN